MQDKKKQKGMQLSEYANSLITDMKTLSNTLKPLSKNLYQNNNRVLNEVLTGKQQELNQMILRVLGHTLQVAQYKTLVSNVLAILNKSILCVKSMEVDTNATQKAQTQLIISSIVDILLVITNQNRETQQISLRVLQTTFSLIDHGLVQYFTLSIVTRIFAICFQFCIGVSMVQNISVSALFALIQAIFQFGVIKESFLILSELMQYLFEAKKFVWIKGKEVKGLVWDLVVIGVRNFTPNHIIGLDSQPECLKLLLKMYQIVTQSIFLKKSKSFYTPPPPPQKAQPQPQSSDIADFIRYFKAYVALSTSLSIQSYKIVEKEHIPFRSTIPKLGIVCDLQRNSRMFIFLESICEILLNQYDLPVSLDKGIIFMEVLSKISEELCWCNQTGVQVNWQLNQSYLHKVVHEQPKINDGDFVRLIKNTIFQMRMKFEKDEDLISCKKNGKVMDSARSSRSVVLPENLGNSKKWEAFMKNVVRIVRYLSSLNFITQQTDEDPTRKIILELQYWFLICPVSKAKNMVLQQLLITANVLNNKMQAVKVSQSVQIGSNILYGYYEDLDSMGLTIILKMMAGIKADWQQGKSFEQLDEVYNLVNNIFNEQNLITNQPLFLMTVQALVQCTNSLIADIEQPKQKQPTNQSPSHPIKRFHKMIQFLLQKMITVIGNHLHFGALQWNFITGFLITLCMNKNVKIKEDGVKAIGALVSRLLKAELGQEIDDKKQMDILGLYEELAKSKMQKDMELAVIDQLKMIMPRIRQQVALMDGFRIVKILSDSQSKNVDVIASIHQLQQILVKDCLFRITELKYLRLIVDGMQIKASQKNEQYRLINLLWAIADYFRKITPKQNIPNQYIELWEALFKNIWNICESSRECETKQSAIHCSTQILAEVLSHLPFDFIIIIISKYYHEMVLLLLGIHNSSLADSEKSSETAKVALKNYIKLFKKLISIEQKSEQDKRQISKNFSSINQNITKHLLSYVQKRNTGPITLELLFQLSNFILVVSEDIGFADYGVKSDLRDMFNAIEDIIKVCEESAESGAKMDLKSHMFKKKLKPLLDKIREIHDKEKKQQVIAVNKGQKIDQK